MNDFAGSLGSRGIPRRELIFDGCVVAADHVLCGAGEFRKLIEIFNTERIHNAAMAVGTAQGALDHALDYAKSRVQFGKSIYDFQGIRWRLADMAAELEAARALLYQVARQVESGSAIGYASSLTKLVAGETACRVVDGAMQIEGATGYHEGVVQAAYRNVRMTRIAAGSSEILRNHIAAVNAR